MEASSITTQNFSGPGTGFGMQPNGSFNMPKPSKFVENFLKLRTKSVKIKKK
jgi:hypothetical protein